VNRHGLDDDVPSSPLSSALMKRKAEIQDGQATAGKAGVESYTKSVMRRHNLDDGAASSPLSSALLQRKAQNQQKVVEHVDPVQVGALVSMFEMFDMYDIDGNGFIDKDEYWAISSQLPRADGLEWTREMSDDEVDTIDTNGDGVISPEEFYRHCRKNISANEATYAEALAQHQDVFFNPGELDLLDSQDYVKDVLSSHGLKNEELPSSPLASAIMAKKRGTYKDQPTLAQNVILRRASRLLLTHSRTLMRPMKTEMASLTLTNTTGSPASSFPMISAHGRRAMQRSRPSTSMGMGLFPQRNFTNTAACAWLRHETFIPRRWHGIRMS